MPGNALPLLLAAGVAAVALSGKKKKSPTSKPSSVPCDEDTDIPEGYVCDAGFIRESAVDEEDLEADEEPEGEEAGDFDTKEEDVSVTEDEEMADLDEQMPVTEEADPALICEEFIKAVHVTPSDDDEIPINKIAVEQNVIPKMKEVLSSEFHDYGKPINHEVSGPKMVAAALTDLIPICVWKYDDTNGEFIYNDGRTIDSDAGKQVIYGLIKISTMLIDDFNAEDDEPIEIQNIKAVISDPN